MTEKNEERQKAFEALEEGITNYLAVVEKATFIFSKIRNSDPDTIEEFKAILLKVSYLKDEHGTIKMFDKRDLQEIAGTLNHLRGNLNWIKNMKEREK